MPALPVFPELHGRVALVTGADRGIGEATAIALLTQGMRVAVTHLPTVEAPRQFDSIGPGEVLSVPLDLRDAASMSACFDAVERRWGALDVLVNNAAVGSATVSAVAEDAEAEDEAMLLINALGPLQMCRRAIDHAAGQALKIINLSSVGGGITQFPGFRLSDGMSKAAVAHLTRQLAAEHSHDGIDVFAVCPGATDTPMFQASTLASMTTAERAAFVGALPKQRLIAPADIAALIVWLASDHSTVMHGAVIDASMGLGVRPGVMTERHH